MSGFLRHIEACNDAVLPGGRALFRLAGADVGYLAPALADRLAGTAGARRTADALHLDAPAGMAALATAAVALGHGRHRGEDFDIRAVAGGPVLGRIDRGALPVFGVQAEGIHLNGLVRRRDGLHVWVGTRAADKALDPGKLDHIVAGGMSAGHTPWGTLIKEAAEEAAIPEALATRARPVGTVTYAMARPEGLRRDVLHCYDLELPEDFTPVPHDGEVDGFALWPIGAVMDAVRDSDRFKFNVNVVLIDLFLREGLIAGREAATLRRALAG